MRINKFIALSTGMSRRAADTIIEEGGVTVNGHAPTPGQAVSSDDDVRLNGEQLLAPETKTLIALNKPKGYVCSRDGQGAPTIYGLLPEQYQHLKSVGRLDKDTTGLILLTNDGDLANKLTHPSFAKTKVYMIELDKDLEQTDTDKISKQGVKLQDGLSKLELDRQRADGKHWQVTMHEGRNRQIRRTFEHLGYKVVRLHRTEFGPYTDDALAPTQTFMVIEASDF